MLIINKIQTPNRNKKCYGYRNKKCYGKALVTNCISNSCKNFVTICYGQKHSKLADYQAVTGYRNRKSRNIFLEKFKSEKPRNYRIILRAKQTGDFYEAEAGINLYKNLSTGQVGVIDLDIVHKHLVIPVAANEMQMRNENLIHLIDRLGLAQADPTRKLTEHPHRAELNKEYFKMNFSTK